MALQSQTSREIPRQSVCGKNGRPSSQSIKKARGVPTSKYLKRCQDKVGCDHGPPRCLARYEDSQRTFDVTMSSTLMQEKRVAISDASKYWNCITCYIMAFHDLTFHSIALPSVTWHNILRHIAPRHNIPRIVLGWAVDRCSRFLYICSRLKWRGFDPLCLLLARRFSATTSHPRSIL